MKWIFIFFPILVFANPWDKVPSGIYTTKETTTLEKILVEKFKVSPELLVFEDENGNLLTKIKDYNPHIKNWDPLPIGTKVYIEIPKNAAYEKIHERGYLHVKNATHPSSKYLKKKIRESRIAKKEEIKKKKVEVYLSMDEERLEVEEDLQQYLFEKEKRKEVQEKVFPKAPKNKFGLFGFYATSQGTFNQTVASQGVSGKNEQNSPMTLGAGFHFKLKEDRWYSGSGYFSYLNTTAENELGEAVSIPSEIGLNLYYNMAMSFPGLSFYWGADRESFSTFNLDELQGGELLQTRTQTITYLTFGFSQFFLAFDKLFLLKASYSTVFWSESSPKSTVSEDEYEGSKYILHLNYFFSPSYALFGFYKVHNLNGPDNLNIARIGFGISKTFY